MDIQSLENLINEFEKLPKIISQPTYLEICRYPRSRFEEICSRILCFYFDPSNEHGFNELFLDSLFELLTKTKIHYRNNQIKVINEENSEGKRLDILIHSPNFVIGIENKINAPIYNPLEIYKNRIELYNNEAIFKVVLSVRKITDKAELLKISNNGFVLFTYSELFHKIKKNTGKYITQGNQKYLTYMYDFIQTIENMNGDTFENNKLSLFFSNNSEKIDELSKLYAKYKQRTLDIQKDRIAELKQKIISQSIDQAWWIYDGWDLGYNSFNKNTDKPIIGLESSYKTSNNNPLGVFRIYITTWKIKDYKPYESELFRLFPNNHLDKTTDDRVYLHMDVIEDDNEVVILEKLAFYYNILFDIVKKLS
jgi:hypothetical protein